MAQPKRSEEALAVPTAVTPRKRVLEPGSPEEKRLDELLAIMRDEQRTFEERFEAAKDAMPLQYLKPDPIVVHSGTVRLTNEDGRTIGALNIDAVSNCDGA